MEPTEGKTVARIAGRFALIAPNGVDLLRPNGRALAAKARALVAILLRSAEMRCTRREAQDLLWSDRGYEQAQGSLRQILSQLRKAPIGQAGLIDADREHIWLDQTRIQTETDEVEAGWDSSLFQDLKLRDPAFNQWLAAERHKEATGIFPMALPKPNTHLIWVEEGPAPGRGVARRIAASVAEWVPVEVDLSTLGKDRPEAGVPLALKISDFSNPDGSGENLSASLSWSHGKFVSFHDAPITLDGVAGNRELFRLVNAASVRAMEELRAASADRSLRGPNWTPANSFDAIRAVFEQRGDPSGQLSRFFSERFDEDKSGIHLAWQAFLLTYVLGERKGVDRDALQEQAQEFVVRAMELEPGNSMVLALASHVQGFLRGEYALACDLAERAVSINPANALAWSFLSLANCYLGRIAEANEQAKYARDIAGEGPHSYLIDSIALISATLAGELERAIWLSESVLLRAPDYKPPLRYLYAIHARLEQWNGFRRARERLTKLEPDFSHELFMDGEYPVRGLRESGFLSELPRNPRLL